MPRQLRYELRVRRESIDATVTRLRAFVRSMERRYGRSSEEMLEDVASGKTCETAEVARWLIDYGTLQYLTRGEENEPVRAR